MGTNYYLIKQLGEICPHCQRGTSQEKLHIGKSSGGWCFSLHVIPEEGINDLEDWRLLFQKFKIKNEYDEEILADKMMEVICVRSWKPIDETMPPSMCKSWNKYYDDNYAKRGPQGLLRHKLITEGGYNCIKNGEGTWDCITGEFS